MITKDKFERLLEGKTILRADLNGGTVKLEFTDGTRFEREKTCEGVITAILKDSGGNVIESSRVYP